MLMPSGEFSLYFTSVNIFSVGERGRKISPRPVTVNSADNRRRAAAAPRPSSARAAGAGGSSNTMLKLYTDSGEAGLKV